MKLDTKLLAFKIICYLGAAACLQLVNALAQWADGTSSPGTIQWVIIIATTMAALFNAGLSFFSSSWSDWKSVRNGNGNGQPPADTNGQKPTT